MCVCVCVCVCVCSKFPVEVLSDEAVMQLLALSALRMEHMQVCSIALFTYNTSQRAVAINSAQHPTQYL